MRFYQSENRSWYDNLFCRGIANREQGRLLPVKVRVLHIVDFVPGDEEWRSGFTKDELYLEEKPFGIYVHRNASPVPYCSDLDVLLEELCSLRLPAYRVTFGEVIQSAYPAEESFYHRECSSLIRHISEGGNADRFD